jgi:exopolysaccharide biosynthesis predicted pyruvyltransferase EpsI
VSELIDETKQSKNTIQLLDREHDFSYFIQILKNAELVISTRLHLFLIASFLGVPTKVYPYQRKILKMKEVIETKKLT